MTVTSRVQPEFTKSQTPRKTKSRKGFGKEAPVGVEPTMTDLQSVALATWPRSQRVILSTELV